MITSTTQQVRDLHILYCVVCVCVCGGGGGGVEGGGSYVYVWLCKGRDLEVCRGTHMHV